MNNVAGLKDYNNNFRTSYFANGTYEIQDVKYIEDSIITVNNIDMIDSLDLSDLSLEIDLENYEAYSYWLNNTFYGFDGVNNYLIDDTWYLDNETFYFPNILDGYNPIVVETNGNLDSLRFYDVNISQEDLLNDYFLRYTIAIDSTGILDSYTLDDFSPIVLEYSEKNFSVTESDGVVINFLQWFWDGVLQTVDRVFHLNSGNRALTNPENNVTVYINTAENQVIKLDWNVTIQDVPLSPVINDFYQSPTNTSWDNNLIVANCDVSDEDLINSELNVNISYKMSSSTDWIDLIPYYSDELWKADYTTTTNYSLIGKYDFRCEVSDGTSNITAYQTDLESVNVYDVNVKPSNPTVIYPLSGNYDVFVPLTCEGSEDVNFNQIYTTIEVNYLNSTNQSTGWKTISSNSSSNSVEWYVLRLREQNNISVRCKTSDGTLESNYYTVNTTIDITHDNSLALLDVGLFSKKYTQEVSPYNVYCSIEGMNNTKIHETWADCNNDGLWDYVFSYNQTIKNYNMTLNQVDDYFSCIWSDSGKHSINIGCVTERVNDTLEWDKTMCKNINNEAEYCNYQKAYQVEINER
jgi:hypothetical protein